MPIIGRHRKAKPKDVFEALKDRLDTATRPGRHESFAEYLVRCVPEPHDPVLVMLIELGRDEPSRLEYLQRLAEVRESLYSVTDELNTLWPDV